MLEEEGLPARAAEKGAYAYERLRGLEESRLVGEVRSIGMMIGIELRQKSRAYLQELHDRGILALPAGPTVVRLLPPLNILDDEWDQVLDAVVDVLGNA